MESDSLVTTLRPNAANPSTNMWQQTVAQYVTANLEIAPIPGDTVAVNDEWSLVIKEVDNKGALRTIGLKRQDLPMVN